MKSPAAKQKKAPPPPLESRSLAKGLAMMEALALAPEPMSLGQLSAVAGLGKASTLRLLHTLRSTGYLVRGVNDDYSLGCQWPSIKQQNRLRAVRERARPLLAKMNAELGETVALAFLFDDVIRVVDVFESSHNIRMSNYAGRVLQPYASSLGKAIAAFQSPALVQQLLHIYGIFSLTPNTLTDFRAIQDDLAAVRERGYAWDREETVPGGQCIGAPIRSASEGVFSAISVSMPKVRFTMQLEELLPGVMLDYAAQIARSMSAVLL